MIITCPACSTRYLIDPRALGVTGRTVRCTNCAHTWVQLPPEDAPRRVDLPPPDAMAPPPPPRQIAAPQPAKSKPPARPGGRSIVVPLVVTLIIVIVLGLLWYQRDLIMARFPSLTPVYGALGFAAGDPRGDFEFRKVSSNREDANGHSTLVIQGEVANISRLAHDVPHLRVTLQDANKHALKSWTVTATRERLLPGATVAFKTSVQDPSDDTAGATVTFDLGSD